MKIRISVNEEMKPAEYLILLRLINYECDFCVYFLAWFDFEQCFVNYN